MVNFNSDTEYYSLIMIILFGCHVRVTHDLRWTIDSDKVTAKLNLLIMCNSWVNLIKVTQIRHMYGDGHNFENIKLMMIQYKYLKKFTKFFCNRDFYNPNLMVEGPKMLTLYFIHTSLFFWKKCLKVVKPKSAKLICESKAKRKLMCVYQKKNIWPHSIILFIHVEVFKNYSLQISILIILRYSL